MCVVVNSLTLHTSIQTDSIAKIIHCHILIAREYEYSNSTKVNRFINYFL